MGTVKRGNEYRRGDDDTRFKHRHTRRSAQFSLGNVTLLLKWPVASPFLPTFLVTNFAAAIRFPLILRLYPLYFRAQSLEKWQMPIRRTLPFACLWLCLLFAALSGIAAAPPDFPFIVDSWSVEDALPDSAVISIIQAKDGYLWLGTRYGLVRFDGNQFTVFDEMNTPTLKSDTIVFLYEDSKTNLWIGTQSAGLAVIQNGKIKSFEAETASSGTITSARDDQGDILFYSEKGITRYHDGRMNFFPNIYSPQLFLLTTHQLVPCRDGGVWQLWNGVIQKFNGDRLEKDFGPCPWKARVSAACEDHNGNLIVGTLGEGVFWFGANGKSRQISKEDGLSSDFVLSLCLDSEGDLWVGTDGGGLNRVKRKLFNSPGNFHSWAVQSLSQDQDGGIWAAFGASGASYWRSNSFQDFRVGPHQAAWEVLADRRGQVWAGTRDDGLFLLHSNQFVSAPGVQILGTAIFALFESRDGRIWTGSQNGLGCWDGQNWKLYTTHDGLSGNDVRAITEDASGNLWIGTENKGLDHFSEGKINSHQTTTNGLPGNDISCLYVDSDGILWAGTAGHGLARFENGKWTSFSTDNGLASNIIGYIIGDDHGYLWIGSNRGLMRIERKSFAGSHFCRVYGKADGLPTRECSSGSQPAAIQSRNGELLFPTTEGLVSIDPAALEPNVRQPQVLIESIEVDGHEQNTNQLDSAWSPAAVVPPGGEQLDIHYAALNFSSPQNLHFKYRLEGGQTGWTDAKDSYAAHYTGLLPGHYRFHLIACNEDGVWNQAGSWADIYVTPHYWQTNTFRIAAILFALVVIIGIVRYVSTQKLQQELQSLKQKEALEHERARIARDLHDQIGANLTQVALLGEMAETDKNLPDEVESHTRQISQTARETTRSLDEIVWAINPSNDTLEGLANYICKYAQEYLALASLPCRVDVPAGLPAAAIAPEVRHNVFLAFKEAVHNVVKHAQASEAWIRLRLEPECFILEVRDNGRGMNQELPQHRNGLRNMKKRMMDIGGDFSISPRDGGGTLVQLTAPLNARKENS
jgi:signal transduction histidine kinase/ligand-binding sensor domain-containing protein